MQVLRTVKDLRTWRSLQKNLGFIPTMGALHEGHMSMVRKSAVANNSTVLSVFVNPSQFAPHEDLDRYPRTLDADVKLFTETALKANPNLSLNNLAVFAPKVSEMYPSGITLEVGRQRGAFVEVLGNSHILEGAVRPQFFRGVATVVCKLLNAVQPDIAYFGQKDVQQSVIVQQMVRDLLIPTTIDVSPTQREPSGLALSSRNAYLSPETKKRAAILYKALCSAQDLFTDGVTDANELINTVYHELSFGSDIIESIDYVSMNTGDTFDPVTKAKVGDVLSVALQLREGVRIIDNIILE